VAPLLIELYGPRSVADVGCGQGAWLAAFRSAGVEDILGVDGPQALEAGLLIPRELFVGHDLERPFEAERTFDLVISLEVAEHLDPAAARTFVSTLVGLGRTVVFSAAIPCQGGTHHVNLRWQSYWAELFAEHGYAPDTRLRETLWSRSDVEPWYIQNIVTYSHSDSPVARERSELSFPLDVVHPETYLRLIDPDHASLRDVVRKTVAMLIYKLRQRAGRPT
jgi:SAM-dependent methyltransferase